jgi:hypothetical protein
VAFTDRDYVYFDRFADSLENYSRLLEAGVLYDQSGPISPEDMKALKRLVKKLRKHDTSILYEED